ncbi:histidine phosphatase family protein [Limnohabitans sp. T6-5]|uniref:histidine phosphatase family protein n=1 Tax=Limnohabitans sp. T6-5 TaxID=1100724 RepID=UPI0011B214FB|nr:histidine phosphatase family protein [Limnohabitans sp. T6-5]
MIVNEIARFLANDSSRLVVFIRHGEKDLLAGGPALITQQAKIASEQLGLSLRKFKLPIKIYSSPELRCVQTAEILNFKISEGCESDITITSFLGQPGVQVRNNKRYLEIFNEHGARAMYTQWKNGKNYDALRTTDELCIELSKFLEKTTMESKISLFVSQSGTIAALGYALGLRNYDPGNNDWVPFLDGFVLVCK